MLKALLTSKLFLENPVDHTQDIKSCAPQKGETKKQIPLGAYQEKAQDLSNDKSSFGDSLPNALLVDCTLVVDNGYIFGV